jgi:carboxypeptidase C (cathepsin A)
MEMLIVLLLAGYSFTSRDDGYAKNETVIGEELYNALLQFFQLFPELQKSEFYVTGESYAGKSKCLQFVKVNPFCNSS